MHFALNGRDFEYFERSPIRFYYEKNAHGRVIADMTLAVNKKFPLMNFYVLKEGEYNEILKREFKEEYLLKYLKFYKEMRCIMK